ncbi:MAG: type II toxin-antitoxin system RelE/ParE family toxin [Patescibacteria group bacterium]|mgnify:CR=1 FL=1
MSYRIEYTKEATRDLKKLDFSTAQRMVKKIHFWGYQPDPLHFAKPLQGMGPNKYRFRVGDYRIIFEINKRGQLVVLLILRVAHRREVYRV